jgi:hypothetical protein
MLDDKIRIPHCSKFDPDLAAKVCELIAEGLSLRQIGAKEGMPDKRDVMGWRNAIPEFAEQYARAKDAQMEHYAEEMIAIADDGTNDWMEREGVLVADHEVINRSKLRVDTRKWIMAKLAPKRYGERIALTNADGGMLDGAGRVEVNVAIANLFGDAAGAVGQPAGLLATDARGGAAVVRGPGNQSVGNGGGRTPSRARMARTERSVLSADGVAEPAGHQPSVAVRSVPRGAKRARRPS